jgi:hypothetical protein
MQPDLAPGDDSTLWQHTWGVWDPNISIFFTRSLWQQLSAPPAPHASRKCSSCHTSHHTRPLAPPRLLLDPVNIIYRVFFVLYHSGDDAAHYPHPTHPQSTPAAKPTATPVIQHPYPRSETLYRVFWSYITLATTQHTTRTLSICNAPQRPNQLPRPLCVSPIHSFVHCEHYFIGFFLPCTPSDNNPAYHPHPTCPCALMAKSTTTPPSCHPHTYAADVEAT